MNKIEWKEIELGKIISNKVNYPIGDGDHGQIKPSMYQNQGVPYIRVGDMIADKICLDKMVYISEKVHNDNLKSELLPGDVIIAKTGATIGKVAIIPKSIQKANTTSSVGKITVDKSKILPEYLLYFIKTNGFIKQMWSVSNKSAQPGFNIINLKKFKILLPFYNGKPDLKEQEKIVNILEKAEKLKEKGKKSEELLDEYLKSVFNEMFLNRGFEKVKLRDLCLLITKGTTPTTYGHAFTEEGINFLKIENIDEEGNIIMNSLKYISPETHKLLKRSQLHEGDILFSIAGALGRIAVIKKEHIPANINQAIAIIRLKSSHDVDKKYLEYYFKSGIVIQQITNNKRGVAQLNLNLEQIGNLDIILPPIPLQQKFAEIVKQVEGMKKNLKKTNKNSEELFNLLMNKTFGGEL